MIWGSLEDALIQWSPTFLAPGTGSVEDNFSMNGGVGVGAMGRQNHSPPAVPPDSLQAMGLSVAQGLGILVLIHLFTTFSIPCKALRRLRCARKKLVLPSWNKFSETHSLKGTIKDFREVPWDWNRRCVTEIWGNGSETLAMATS